MRLCYFYLGGGGEGYFFDIPYVFCPPQNQKASWVDGSEWGYSDWKPGHPNIQTDKPVCLEMFQIGKTKL